MVKGRKTSPCSKGIETRRYQIQQSLLSKDIALLERDWDFIRVRDSIFYIVERHRPARKGLRPASWQRLIKFTVLKNIALIERDFEVFILWEVKKTAKNLLIFDRTLFEEGINV